MTGQTNPKITSFEFSESGLRLGTEVRPTPKWQYRFRNLSRSLRFSLGRLLLEECGSLLLRIRARTRIRPWVFGAKVPPCPQSYPEAGSFSSECSFQRACSAHTIELQKANSWMGVLDVQLTMESWRAGFESACDMLCNERNNTE